MTPDNLELVRSIYADWELGDWGSATWAHPDIAYVMVDEPGSHVYVGLAEMARAWRSFLSAWEDYRIEPVEYRLLDGERVLVSCARTAAASPAASSSTTAPAAAARTCSISATAEWRAWMLTSTLDTPSPT